MFNKKKICLLIPSLQAGGMERVISELASYFCEKEDIEVHLVLYGIRPEFFYRVPDKVTVYEPVTVFNKKYRFIHSIKRLAFLRKTVKRINPDTILSFGELWNSFVLIALWFLRYPVFISDRCSPSRPYKLHNRLLRRLLYPKAKGVIAQTVKAKELYERQFRNRNIRVIGNPIRSIRNNGLIKRENIVLSVGRLILSKHHDKLIEIFTGIDVPGWKLIIVGDDALKQSNYIRLKKLVDELNVADRVILVGKQSELDNYYLGSKIFAFTSSSEGFPNVIGEAMSAGLPVVAFDCIAGPGEMIRDNHSGFLVPLFDYHQFKKRLESLMINDDMRAYFGKNAGEDIKRYTISIIGEQYLNFILGKQ